MVVMEEETAAYLMAKHMVLPIQTSVWVEAQVQRRVLQQRSPRRSSFLCGINYVRYFKSVI